MPTTLSALVVIVFAIVPGVLGETVYRLIVGTDWRQSEWERVVRIVTFSVGGLLVCGVALLSVENAPIPDQLSDLSIDTAEDAWQSVHVATLAYLSHFIASSFVGGLVALVTRAITAGTRMSTYPDTWDVFARRYVTRHWIVITLNDGASFAGMIERADTSVQRSERDIVLVEPALFNESTRQYVTMPYQYLYLPGTLIASVGVYYNEEVDPERLVPINEPLFKEA